MSGGLYNTHKRDFDTVLDKKHLKPYGDTMNDGKVQMSFTLPIENDDKGAAAAALLAEKMGLIEPNVALRKSLDKGFTFYVVYGSTSQCVDYESLKVAAVEQVTMTMEETDDYIRKNIGRKIVVVGASTGTDAHTVGIDAIMNRKGFAGHYGLERYEMVEAINFGSQIPNEEF
ncbi:MAG: OAM dimerization domain-containing protein, partial [Clostridia bacterium]